MKRMGSSPRMRGTPAVAFCSHATSGLIPTYAGNTIWRAGRVQKLSGSSPRMRGTRTIHKLKRLRTGLIPTYAGNTRQKRNARFEQRAHPHVCGEHYFFGLRLGFHVGSSPRVWGAHLLTWDFIPTHQVLELVWSPKPVLTLHDFWAYRRREARLYLLALLHPFRGPRSSFGADGRIISFTPSKSTGSHG